MTSSTTLYNLMMDHPNQGIIYLEMDSPYAWEKAENKEHALAFVLDHLKLREINQAMLEMVKSKRSDLIGLTIRDIGKSVAWFDQKNLLNLLENGTREAKSELHLPDGQVLLLKGNSVCHYNTNNELIGIFSIQKNITGERKRRRELQKRDQLLLATTEAGNYLLREQNYEHGFFKALKTLGEKLDLDRIYIFERDKAYAPNNRHAKLRMKWSTKTPDTKIETGGIQSFSLDKNFPEIINKLQSGVIVQGTVDNLSKTERDFLISEQIKSILCIPIFIKDDFWGFIRFDNRTEKYQWSDGETAILKSFSANIGMTFEREKIQQHLTRSQNMFTYITENIDEVFYVRDTQMNIIYLNEAFEEISGIPVEVMLTDSKVYTNRIHPDDLPTIQKAPLNEKVTFEYRYLHKDGSIKHITNKRAPVYDESGNLVRYVGVISDITDIKKAQEELEELLNNEKELHDLKNRFISMISHEIRTPLTAIVSSAELIENFTDRIDQEKKQQLNKRILGASEKILILLEDVLLIGKSDAGKLRAEYEEIDLTKFTESLLNEIKLTTLKNNTVHFAIHTSSEKVCMDKKLMSHILINLLENASKYSDEGSNIWLSIEQNGDSIQIMVKDEGMGISEEEQKKIFDPFYRGKEVTDIEGTGLGMPIIQRSVNALGGSLELTSTIKKGSTFTVTIPKKNR